MFMGMASEISASGFAIGFDMMVAEAIVSLKRSYPDIALIAAPPLGPSVASFMTGKRYDRLLRLLMM